MTMLKPPGSFAWRRSAVRQARKTLCMALSVFLLFQGCAAPLAGVHRQPSAAADAHATSATVAVGVAGRAQEAAAARAAIPAGMDPAPDLEGRPLPANPDQMASGDARAMAGGKATGEAKRLAEGWLGQFGTARLDLLGSFHGGALDMLFPVRDSGTGLIFSQFGVRRTNLLQESYRTTVNLGLGYRHFADGYMVGGNAFLDQDVSRGHRRLGLGGEWWADYLKLGMNGYFRLSDWKRSPDARDYQERPASGWDIRTEGYLPQYPQLGGKLMFEKYYGDEVGLFGASNRQSNPSAWTLGVSYTPAPAVTLGLDHRMGQGGKSDTSFKLGLKVAIGVPLAKQLQPGAVASSRQLAGMRMDLVERNNEIVLEYKKNAPLTIQLPSAVNGYPQTMLSFPVTIAGSAEAPTIEWSGSAAAFAMPYGGGGSGAITLPPYNIGGVNSYRLTATAIDAHGRKISSNIMEVSVNPLSLSVARSKAAAIADGMDSVRFTAQLRGIAAEPMAGRAIAWAVHGPGAIQESSDRTDADGLAYVMVSSKVAALVEVEATEAQGFKGRNEAEFLAAPGSASVAQLDATPASILANGRDKTLLTATVKDGKGNAVGAGVAVNWTAAGGQLASNSSNTDASGIAVTELLAATVPGTAVVTAKAGADDPGKTRSVDFLLDASDAKVVMLTPSKTSALANGIDTVTLTATVADGRGNPVGAGTAVHWGSSLGKLGAASSSTDANSQATIVLAAPTAAGVATVSARGASGDAGKTAAIVFVADASSARVVLLTPSEASGVANGTATLVFTATVEDGRGNPVGAGITVNWTANLGAIAATSITNASSQATVTLTAPLVPGMATITAKAADGDAGKTASAVFTANILMARVAQLTPSKTSGLANGTDTVTLTATVDDGRGNPVGAGVAVRWTTDRGTIEAASVTDASSQATVVLTAPTLIGPATVTAKCAPGRQGKSLGSDPGKTAAIAFTADASNARVVALAPSKTTGVANGTDTVTFTATLADVRGNPVGAGIAVNWGASAGTLAGTTSTTNVSSEATVVLTAPTAGGVATVTAKGASGDAGKTTTVTFTADASNARVVALAPSKATGVANGTDTVTFTATLADARGNPVGAGIAVNWGASAGTLAGATSTTNASSQATVVLTAPTAAGVATVSARGASGDAGQTTSVMFTADASTARVVALAPSKTSGVADGTDTVTFTATVRDLYGNPMGAGVAVNWTTTAGALAAASSSTDSSGKATVVLTAPTAAGVAAVTAKGASGDVGKTATVTFTAKVVSARVVSVGRSKTSAVANGTDTVTLTAKVLDAAGNPVGAGVNVHWSTNNGTLASATSATDASSQATVVLTTAIKTGRATVRAKGTAEDVGRTADIEFVADASTARVVELFSYEGSGFFIDDKALLRARVEDVNGNPMLGGVMVNWSTDFGSMWCGATSLTDSNGFTQCTLVPERDKAGIATVAARVGAADPGRSIVLTFKRYGAEDTVIGVFRSKDTGVADGKDTVTLRADVRDRSGGRVGTGVTVNWTTTGGTLAAPTSTTGANSEAVIVLTAPDKAGAVSVTAKARESTKDPGKTVTLNFTGGNSSTRVGNFSASKTSILANDRDTATFTAVVLDANGNLGGAGHVVNWGTDLGTLDTSASTTNGKGEATAVLRGAVAGLASVTAKAGAGDSGRTVRVTLTADPLSARVATLAASKSKALANGSDTLTLTALVADARGNPVGAGVTVNWSSSRGTLAATSVTNGKSETSVVLTAPTAAGMATIVAKAANGDAGKTVSATFTADLSTARVVSLVPLRATGTTFPAGVGANVAATVQDAYGNPVGAGVTITWSSESAILDLDTSRTFQDSTATNTVRYYSAGTVSVKAHAVAGDPGKTLAMNYVADPSRDYVTTLNASQSTGVADGSGTVTFTAAVRNQFNDPVGAGVTVHWTTTGGALAAPTSMTNAAGVASIVLTAPTVAGEVEVSAKAGANDQNNNFAVVTFKNGASSLRVGSASANKTRIVANGRDSVLFTAMVVDGNGNPGGEGHTVNWSTDLGALNGATSKTNASGAAAVMLKAGAVAGPASVTAKVGAGDSGATVRVTLMADPLSPRVTSVTASKTSGRANGTDTLTLTATVKDVNGNLEDAGIIVNWRTDLGTLAAATSSTNARGVAKVELRAPTSPGTAVLSAKTVAADPGKTVRVKFESDTVDPGQP
ncbi:Ig-like domain-containing protein [Achromobacter anxifer]